MLNCLSSQAVQLQQCGGHRAEPEGRRLGVRQQTGRGLMIERSFVYSPSNRSSTKADPPVPSVLHHQINPTDGAGEEPGCYLALAVYVSN